MGAKSYVKYIVPGAAQGGIIQKAIIPAGVLIGGYIVISRITGFNPLADAAAAAGNALNAAGKAVGDAVGTISQPVGDAITSASLAATNFVVGLIVGSPIRFSKNPAAPGDTIQVKMTGLQPYQVVQISCVPLSFDTGEIRAGVLGDLSVDMPIPDSTAAGTYQVNAVITYVLGDKKYFAQLLTIKVATEPPPPVYNILNLNSPDNVVTVSQRIRFDVQLYDVTTPVPISGVRVALAWNTNIVAVGSTDSNGHYSKSFYGSFFGTGTHTMYAQPYPFNGETQAGLQDHMEFVVN